MTVQSARSPSAHDVHGEIKPRLRGLLHAWSVAPMAIAGVFLVAAIPTARARYAVAVYALAINSMLVASSVYHRAKVSPERRLWLRRVDHSMIGVAVAGTYTPVVVLIFRGWAMALLLVALWCGALGVMALSLLWLSAPSWIRAGAYLLLGWAGVAITPWLFSRGGVAVFVLVVLGAMFYTLGAVTYARRRPNPWPDTYGFHEIFHTLVVLAAITHFAAVAVLALRS